MFSYKVDSNVILIAPARRTGAAHSRVGDGTVRVSDMKEKRGMGALRSIANRCLAFPHVNFNWQLRSFSSDPQAGTSWK